MSLNGLSRSLRGPRNDACNAFDDNRGSLPVHAGKMMADAAAAAGVKVFVFSTLEDVEKRTKASYP